MFLPCDVGSRLATLDLPPAGTSRGNRERARLHNGCPCSARRPRRPEASLAQDVRVLLDQLHAHRASQHALRGEPDQVTARLAVLVLGTAGVYEDRRVIGGIFMTKTLVKNADNGLRRKG